MATRFVKLWINFLESLGLPPPVRLALFRFRLASGYDRPDDIAGRVVPKEDW